MWIIVFNNPALSKPVCCTFFNAYVWGFSGPSQVRRTRATLKENTESYKLNNIVGKLNIIYVDFGKKSYIAGNLYSAKGNSEQPCVIQIQAYWKNNCTVLLTKNQTSKVWGFFDILIGYFLFICQVQESNSMRCAFRQNFTVILQIIVHY